MNVARDTGAPSAQIRSPGPAAGRVIAGERLYYSEPEGGVDLGGQAPDYTDFAYLALTIGMTFQASDTRSPQGACVGSLCTVRCRHTSTGR